MKNKISINRRDLEKILDYLRPQEEMDFENTKKWLRRGHIYNVIKRLDEILEEDKQ